MPDFRTKKRSILLAIIGALIGDASLLLYLYVGPWQWLFGAAMGYSLFLLGIARLFHKQTPTAAHPTP
jgi:hypothetical protein